MIESENLWSQITNILETNIYPKEGQDVFLFGAGLQGTLSVSHLKKHFNVLAFCDNDVNKQGMLIDGIICVSPKALTQYSNPFVLITSIKNYQNISIELSALNVSYCIVDAYVMHRYFRSFFDVYQLLDSASKRVYAGVLLCRLKADISSIEQYCSDQQYFCFPRYRYLNQNDIFVDCGAFVGDIVQKAVENAMGLFRKFYAFEPSEKAFSALKKRVSYLQDIWALSEGQIVCEKKGVGHKNTFLDFRKDSGNLANISISYEESDSGNVEIVSLDQYFSEKKEERITFLKADIEGFEWNMLHGAKEILLRDKPRLAISIYHSIYDFFQIALYLKELVPEYKFAVRHHWNSFDETILYCYLE